MYVMLILILFSFYDVKAQQTQKKTDFLILSPYVVLYKNIVDRNIYEKKKKLLLFFACTIHIKTSKYYFVTQSLFFFFLLFIS